MKGDFLGLTVSTTQGFRNDFIDDIKFDQVFPM